MPRRAVISPVVVVTSRDDAKKITSCEIRKPGQQHAVHARSITCNEWILRTGVGLVAGTGHPPVEVGNTMLSRIVAAQTPTSHADRMYVDHAGIDTCNDTKENLHWVTPAFNLFNTKRKGSASGYRGISKSGTRYATQFQGREHGSYSTAETAARVYDLLCGLAYGDQLAKTPHRHNNLDQSNHVSLTDTRADGIKIFEVDRRQRCEEALVTRP